MPPTLRESYVPGLINRLLTISATNIWYSQSFTATDNYTLTSAKLQLRDDGTLGDMFVDIFTEDGSDLPDTLVQSSNALTDADVDAAFAFVEFTFGTPPTISSGTKYCMVLRMTSGSQLTLGARSTTGLYAGGAAGVSSDSGSSWGLQDGGITDAYFEIYGEDIVSPTKTFTADAKLIQDGVLKTFTADASLTKRIDKTFTADANTVRLKTFTADANLFKDSIPKTFTADAGILKVATKTFAADAHVYVVPDATWPQARAEAYDPDKLWDEETKSWYLPTSSIGVERMAQAGGRLRSQFVAISEQGKIYFGSF